MFCKVQLLFRVPNTLILVLKVTKEVFLEVVLLLKLWESRDDGSFSAGASFSQADRFNRLGSSSLSCFTPGEPGHGYSFCSQA